MFIVLLCVGVRLCYCVVVINCCVIIIIDIVVVCILFCYVCCRVVFIVLVLDLRYGVISCVALLSYCGSTVALFDYFSLCYLCVIHLVQLCY